MRQARQPVHSVCVCCFVLFGGFLSLSLFGVHVCLHLICFKLHSVRPLNFEGSEAAPALDLSTKNIDWLRNGALLYLKLNSCVLLLHL